MKISKKKVSLAVLAFMAAFAAIGIIMAQSIEVTATDAFVGGPTFYPMMLFCLIILFSLWDAVITFREKDETFFEVDPVLAKRFGISALMVFVWVLLWKHVTGFYPASVLMAFLMLYYLNPSESKAKKLKMAFLADAIIMGAVYIIFTVLFTVRF